MEFEQWRTLEEFDGYAVSDLGNIRNEETGRILSQSYNTQGHKKVGLFDGKRQFTRSVKQLVADAFVEGKSDIHNTAMNLDGDFDNNRADNLVWRPRWFVLEYGRQFDDPDEWYLNREIEDVETGETFDDMVEAAIYHGLLLRQILCSVHNEQDVCFPEWRKYKFTE